MLKYLPVSFYKGPANLSSLFFATYGRCPIIRVLCPPLRKDGGHSSGPGVAARLKRPTRGGASFRTHDPGRSRRLFGLASGGVCRADVVTDAAVSSYLAFSPLPVPREAAIGGLFSAALSVASRRPGVTRHPAR